MLASQRRLMAAAGRATARLSDRDRAARSADAWPRDAAPRGDTVPAGLRDGRDGAPMFRLCFGGTTQPSEGMPTLPWPGDVELACRCPDGRPQHVPIAGTTRTCTANVTTV